MTRATAVTKTVVGHIVTYDSSRGYGFAETPALVNGRRIKVFFHINDARQVTRNDGQFTFGEPIQYDPAPPVNHTMPAYIVMEAYLSDRGWRTDTWGDRPDADWANACNDDFFKQYVGGTLSHHDNHPGCGTRGTINTIALREGYLEVGLSDAHTCYMTEEGLVERRDQKITQAWMIGSSRRSNFPDGRLRIDSPHYYGYLVLTPPVAH